MIDVVQQTRNAKAQDIDTWRMLLIQRGSPEAFEKITKKYSARAYRYALKKMGNPAHAEDAVQEIFTRVWEKRHMFEPDAKFDIWFFTITKTVISNMYRTLQRKKLPQAISIPDREDAFHNRPDVSATAKEMRERVIKAMQGVSARQRSALILYYFQGYSMENMAKKLSISEGGCQALLFRARKSIRDLLIHLEPTL
jgi:RNA polymerase sigma-70 factor, ECF subfamily